MLEVQVDASAGPAGRLRASYQAEIRADEIVRLRETLEEMYRRLRGRWQFRLSERYFDLDFEGDGLGHFRCTCVATDDPAYSSHLTFEIEFDQTEIPSMLSSLDRIISRFPVRGSPRD